MMTREELNETKKQELDAWRERRKKELIAEGFPEYIGDVSGMTEDQVENEKEKFFERSVLPILEDEKEEVSGAIDEKYREAEELLTEDEAE